MSLLYIIIRELCPFTLALIHLQCFDAVGSVAGTASGLSKNLSGGCWYCYLSAARCRLAYRPADATATHCLLLQENPDWFTFLVPAHPDSPGQRAVKRVCVYISTNCTMLSTVLLLLCHMQHRQAVSVATLWWRKMKNVMLGLATQTTAATSSAS